MGLQRMEGGLTGRASGQGMGLDSSSSLRSPFAASKAARIRNRHIEDRRRWVAPEFDTSIMSQALVGRAAAGASQADGVGGHVGYHDADAMLAGSDDTAQETAVHEGSAGNDQAGHSHVEGTAAVNSTASDVVPDQSLRPASIAAPNSADIPLEAGQSTFAHVIPPISADVLVVPGLGQSPKWQSFEGRFVTMGGAPSPFQLPAMLSK